MFNYYYGIKKYRNFVKIENKYNVFTIGLSYFFLQCAPAIASTYPDCTSPEDAQTMGQCAYKDFREAEHKLAHESQKLEQRLKYSHSAQRLFKLDQQDWNNYMVLKCSNKTMDIEYAEDGTDSNSRAFCKIKLIEIRVKTLSLIK